MWLIIHCLWYGKLYNTLLKNRPQWPRILIAGEYGVLSKFNIAKTMYAGPFTSKQVEDVKAFFWVVGVIAIFMIACSGTPTINDVMDTLRAHFRNWLPRDTSLRSCYKELNISYIQYNILAGSSPNVPDHHTPTISQLYPKGKHHYKIFGFSAMFLCQCHDTTGHRVSLLSSSIWSKSDYDQVHLSE